MISSESTGLRGWHIVSRILYDGQKVPPDGEPLRYTGRKPIELCLRGLHFSQYLLDAISYTPHRGGEGAERYICRIVGGGNILSDWDKSVCTIRTILWRVPWGSCNAEVADWLNEHACSGQVKKRMGKTWDAEMDTIRYAHSRTVSSLRSVRWAAVTLVNVNCTWDQICCEFDAFFLKLCHERGYTNEI